MQTICLSWFHRKIGPIVHYAYPENTLNENEKMRIADIMDQAFEEGFFTHSFGIEQKTSMNYYFEIYSDWARGNKEMLMVSIIFDEVVPSDIEHVVLSWTIDFAEKLKANKEIFMAFYVNDEEAHETEEREKISQMNEKVQLWVKELYWASVEETRKKTEEEKIATNLKRPEIYSTLKRLSKGPITLDDLKEWFAEQNPEANFDKTIDLLQDEKYIFINEIGVETYILLVREVNVARIPPDCVVTIFEKQPELFEMVEIYIANVQQYFDSYDNMSEPDLEKDRLKLIELVADPRIYNVLSQLRTGPIQKEKLRDLLSEKSLQSLYETLETLKDLNIIEYFQFKGDEHVFLISDIQFSIKFPKYLETLLPKTSKPVVVESYSLSQALKGEKREDSNANLDSREKREMFIQRLQNPQRGGTPDEEGTPSPASAQVPEEVGIPIEFKDPFSTGWDDFDTSSLQVTDEEDLFDEDSFDKDISKSLANKKEEE